MSTTDSKITGIEKTLAFNFIGAEHDSIGLYDSIVKFAEDIKVLRRAGKVPNIMPATPLNDYELATHPLVILWVRRIAVLTRQGSDDRNRANQWLSDALSQHNTKSTVPMTWIVFRKSANTNSFGHRGYWLFNRFGHVVEVVRSDYAGLKPWELRDRVITYVPSESSFVVEGTWKEHLAQYENRVTVKTSIPDDVYPAIVSTFGDPLT